MGEFNSRIFEPTFNRSVKVEVRDERPTSDAGAVLLREADHRLGLVESLVAGMVDRRDPAKIRYTLGELLRERLYCLALGYAAADDVDRLAHDPALRTSVWDRRGEEVLQERLASQPTQSRLVDQLADSSQNRQALRAGLAEWTNRFLRATGAIGACASPRSTRTVFPSLCTASKKAENTTATTRTRAIIRWWPVSVSRENTITHIRARGWVTAFCTPCFAAGPATPRKAACGSCRMWSSRPGPWRAISICGWTRASPAARFWTI